MKHIINYSGGAASWAEAKLAAARYGAENVLLLFADTKTEDEDLYRFLHEGAKNIGSELVIVADGRNIWETFTTERLLGNSRITPCSDRLKKKVLDRWMKQNYPNPDSCVLHFGFNWEETHRCERVKKNKAPYACEFMLHDARLSHADIFEWLSREGIEIPRLYKLGLTHNNCGGGCVKAGKKHWKHLLEVFPERYLEWENNEQMVIDHIGKPVSILKNGVTLRKLREGIEAKREEYLPLFDMESEFGGSCSCISDEGELEQIAGLR